MNKLDKSVYRPKFPDSPLVHIADLVNQETGKTWREENAEKMHAVPVGTLVELSDGVRLWVVYQARDCDETPLYCLSVDKDDTKRERERFYNHRWHCGYSEESLAVIE